jgi:hypothetical protein
MITSENADGPRFALPSKTDSPDIDMDGWEGYIAEAPWRLIGFNRSGNWNAEGKVRLFSTNDQLQEQISKLKKVK